MKVLTIFFVSLLCLQAPTSNNTSLTLENFVFTADELPQGYSAKQIQENELLPCAVTANPFLGEDRSFLDCFARMFTKDAVSLQKVQKGLFSVYEAEAEIGVFGIETDTPETATAIYKVMQDRFDGDSNSGALFKSKNLLIWLWHDREKATAYDAMREMIQARIAR